MRLVMIALVPILEIYWSEMVSLFPVNSKSQKETIWTVYLYFILSLFLFSFLLYFLLLPLYLIYIFSCFIRSQIKDTQPLEMTIWDPPFEEEPLSVVLTPPASEELKPSLILPTCVKDIKVRVTHVPSPGNICVQLLQFDGQLKRCPISSVHNCTLVLVDMLQSYCPIVSL